VTSFVTLLSQWDKQEIEEKLRHQVEFSKRAICKLLLAYDRLLQRNERLMKACNDKSESKEEEGSDDKKTEEVKQEGRITCYLN